jgi:hypothetical protein
MSYKRCFYCERAFGTIPINGSVPLKRTQDHIYPVKLGGYWHQDNLIDACNKCNSLKGHKTLREFEEFLHTWIIAGYQTRNGYTIPLLHTMIANIQKLYEKENKFRQILSKVVNNKH